MTDTFYHNPTFDNIPSAKRGMILAVAAKALAKDGLAGARMKDIAKQAGVSYGSMYNYFPTRDAMIRCLILEGNALQQALLDELAQSRASFWDDLANMITQVQQLALAHKDLIAIWLELSHSSNARFSDEISELEHAGIVFWQQRLVQAQHDGEISYTLHLPSIVHLLDSLISSLLASHSSDIQRKRLASIYASDATNEEDLDDVIAENLIKSLKGMLGLDQDKM